MVTTPWARNAKLPVADIVATAPPPLPQVNQYQAQCKKLPKALREWQAYNDCRRTIDDFLEMLPLFQALAHKSMRERHWLEVMRITGMRSDAWLLR